MIYKWTLGMLNFQHYQNYFLFDYFNYFIYLIFLFLFFNFSPFYFDFSYTDTHSHIFSIFYEFGCKSTNSMLFGHTCKDVKFHTIYKLFQA